MEGAAVLAKALFEEMQIGIVVRSGTADAATTAPRSMPFSAHGVNAASQDFIRPSDGAVAKRPGSVADAAGVPKAREAAPSNGAA
jgi:hypothetical protein